MRHTNSIKEWHSYLNMSLQRWYSLRRVTGKTKQKWPTSKNNYDGKPWTMCWILGRPSETDTCFKTWLTRHTLSGMERALLGTRSLACLRNAVSPTSTPDQANNDDPSPEGCTPTTIVRCCIASQSAIGMKQIWVSTGRIGEGFAS